MNPKKEQLWSLWVPSPWQQLPRINFLRATLFGSLSSSAPVSDNSSSETAVGLVGVGRGYGSVVGIGVGDSS